MSDLEQAKERVRVAQAAEIAAGRELRAAEEALCAVRLAIVAAGGVDVGLAWPLGTILRKSWEGSSRADRYRLSLNGWGDIRCLRLKLDGTPAANGHMTYGVPEGWVAEEPA